MSIVTDVVMLLPGTPDIELVNELIAPLGVGSLSDVSTYAGGRKQLQARVWVAAFNYLPLDRFVEMLRTFAWGYTKPRLFVQEEEEWGFKECPL